MRRSTLARAAGIAAAGIVLAAAVPAQAHTYRCTAPGGRITYQQQPCDGKAPVGRPAVPAPKPPADPASANPACAETSAAILERQAEVRRLEAEGESRAVAQDRFIRPGDNLPATLPNIRQAYARSIVATREEIDVLRQAARKLGCPTH